MIPWLIVGGCMVGFVAIWFCSVHKGLSKERHNLKILYEQLFMHETASAQIQDGPDRETATKMLETNRKIYREAVKNYNHLLKKRLNCIPAFLMRFRPADESGGNNITKQK